VILIISAFVQIGTSNYVNPRCGSIQPWT
jgi:hypothetical protein